MPSFTQKIGKKAEEKVKSYFKKQGSVIIGSNWYCQYGEIDLIIESKGVLNFIEVRFRSTYKAYLGAESINIRKIEKLTKSIYTFLQKNPQYENTPYQLTIASVYGKSKEKPETWQIELIPYSE